MGGRGGAGGTRSTYRGDSTARFRQLGLDANGNPLDGSSGKSGGANQRNKSGTTNAKSGTGGVQNGGSAGGQNRGDSGVTSTVTERDVVVEKPKIPADADLDALFEESDLFDELLTKYPGDVEFRRQYPVYFGRWRATVDVEESVGPTASSPWLASLPKNDYTNDGLDEMYFNALKVNRMYIKSRANKINCQRCAVAVELNAKGYDVKAAPVDEGWDARPYNATTKEFEGAPTSFERIATMWRDRDGYAGEWVWRKNAAGNKQAVVAALENEILSWGEGGRGFVGVHWDQNSAHIFNVEVRDGRIIYIDAQPAKSTPDNGPTVIFDDDGWKTEIDATMKQGVMRVDNLNPIKDVMTWVSPRNDKESNVMELPEFSDEFERRFETGYLWDLELTDEILQQFYEDDLFMAFYYGWESVWRGETNPLPPAAIRNEPVLVELFNKGLELAEVPT